MELNATVDQIQLTTNMIKSTDLTKDWTADDKYPSARVVANLVTENASGKVEYPIGSVVMTQKDLATGETSALANPATLLGLPGTWTLIDKAFKSGTSVIGGPSIQFSPAVNGFSFSVETAVRNDHTLLLQLGLSAGANTSVPTGQTLLTMANLNLSRYGVYGLSYSPTNNIAFAVSNNASSAICYWISGSGELSLRDVITGGTNTHALSSGSYIYINVAIPVPYGDMIDSFCDKFYWKRTA